MYPAAHHLGLLYRAASAINIAHLCKTDLGTGILDRRAKARSLALIVGGNLDDDQREQVAAKCREAIVTGSFRAFPYGFSSPQGFLDARLQFVYGPGKFGLTCATFVLAVFDSVGVAFIEYDSWPIRPGDHRWQEFIAKYLKLPRDHVDRMKQEKIEVPRYKPCEVAGAFASSKYPVSFSRASRLGRKLRMEMIRIRKSNPAVHP